MKIKITLVGGPHCGAVIGGMPSKEKETTFQGVRYVRSARKDPEGHTVFIAEHSRTIKGLEDCDIA